MSVFVHMRASSSQHRLYTVNHSVVVHARGHIPAVSIVVSSVACAATLSQPALLLRGRFPCRMGCLDT